MRTGTAHLPLHPGKAPRWLFERMTVLSRAIVCILVEEQGPEEVLRRLSDPFWFQCLGCVLGFDWHSSGVTTTVLGAMKEGLKDLDREIGLFIAGGKGARSRRTPQEIASRAEVLCIAPDLLIYASKMAAKVDSAAVQDGYQLYHHVFLFTPQGKWAVIQQGMNAETRYARRYHWLGESVSDFVCEPHAAVCCDTQGEGLNMVALESEASRRASAQLACLPPEKMFRELTRAEELALPARHEVLRRDLASERLRTILLKTYERQPEDYRALLGMEGVGPKTLRALALLSELLYGAKPSFRDPARFSFAHGGKDGYPYPVNRKTYDASIAHLERTVRLARMGQRDKLDALRRLSRFAGG